DDDAERFGIIDVAKAPLLTVEENAAFIVAVGIDAAQNLHQGRLAGAVLADQRMDLPRLHREVHVAQGLDAGKALAYAAHFKNCGLRVLCLASVAAPVITGPAVPLNRTANACSSRRRSAPSPSCSCRRQQASG